MRNRYLCEVLNTADKSRMTISTEWIDERIIIMVFRLGMIPLSAETSVTQLRDYTEEDVPHEQSMINIRNQLSGKEADISFCLQNTTLTWRKKIWRRGLVELKPLDDIVILADRTLQLWNDHSEALDDSDRMREDNKKLQVRTDELERMLEKMKEWKDSIVKTLYDRFLLVLNSKKTKISELVKALKEQKRAANPTVYDQATDESESEHEEEKRYAELGEKKQYDELGENWISSSQPSENVQARNPEIPSTSKASSPKYSQESEDDIVLRMEEDSQVDIFA